MAAAGASGAFRHESEANHWPAAERCSSLGVCIGIANHNCSRLGLGIFHKEVKRTQSRAQLAFCIQQMESEMLDVGDAHAQDAHEVDTSVVSTKRRRMQQLIQKSIVMSAERQAVVSSSSIATTSEAQPPSSARSKDSSISSTSPSTAPRSKQQKWTPEDDVKLRELVRRLGKDQWAAVAAHFPGRDRKRCRERFVNHADPQLRPRAWTRQEDVELQTRQRELGSRWAELARLLRSRSPEDVKNRFFQLQGGLASANEQCRDAQSDIEVNSYLAEQTTMPSARAAPTRWTTTEADTLRALVAAHGATNWLFLASHLPGRTDLQCMQQWFQVLDPAVVKGKGSWTAAEDALLAANVATLGPKWTQVGVCAW